MQRATTEASIADARATFTVTRERVDGPLQVHYVLHNTSKGWLYAFDRGNTHAVGIKRQVMGAFPQPLVAVSKDGTTLSHAPMPLGTPAPTSPPIPLATALAAGARHEGTFAFTVPGDRTDAPLRYCLTVAPAKGDVGAPMQGTDDVHRVDGAFGLARETLCTPWLDLGAFAFR